MERYESEPYLREIEVALLAAGASEPGAPAPFYAEVAESVLFPGGGGQPADRGELAGREVVAAARNGGSWRLYLAASAATAERQKLALDWPRRFDLMQQHTAQHLLSALALDRFGWRTTAFHLGEELTDIELDAAELPADQLAALEQQVAEAIRAALPVVTRRVSKDDYEKLEGVRTRGLPAGHEGSVRLVEIAGIDLNTCGGTHLRSTAEIETLKLLHTEPMRGGTRLYWVAGGRVRQRLAAAEARNARLRRLLDTGDAELAAIVEGKLGQLAELKRAKEKLESRLAAAEAAALGDAPFAERHFEDEDLAFLQKLAKLWQAGVAPGLLFATAGQGKDAAFLIATRGDLAIDIRQLGQEAAQLLEGKGGGAGRLFQGKATSLARRAEVAARLLATAGSGS